MKSLLADAVDEKVLKELEDALRFYTSNRPLVDFWDIFGDRICRLEDETIISFLTSPANEAFGFQIGDAEKFLSCMRLYSLKYDDLRRRGPLYLKRRWVRMLAKANLVLMG
jgi:hypothetical protein